MTVYRIVTKQAAGNYDPLNPQLSTPRVVTQWSNPGIVIPANSIATLSKFDNTIIDNPQKVQAFRLIHIAGVGSTFIPQAGDVVKTSEGTLRVLGSTELNPNGQGAIMFTIGATLDTSIVI